MRLTLPTSGAPHARLVLLAQTRRGYGNLSHWITVARRRAEKGSYLAHPGDVEGKVPNAPTLAGLPECLALLVPSAAQSFEEVFAHAMWLKTWFQDRAAIAARAAAPRRRRRARRRASSASPAHRCCRIVAAGDVLMHVRSRKPLQDTLTATRLALAGRRVRPRARAQRRAAPALARPPGGALRGRVARSNTLAARRPAAASRSASCATSIRRRSFRPARRRPSHLRKLTYAEALAAGAFPRRPDAGTRSTGRRSRASSRSSPRSKYEAYFLTVADIVALGARAGASSARAAAAPPTRSSATACDVTEVDPRARDAAVRPLHQRRAQRAARHRHRLRAPAPRGGHPVHLRQVRPAPRRAHRRGHQLPAALGAARRRPRASASTCSAIDAVSKSQHWFDGRGIAPSGCARTASIPSRPVVQLWIELTAQLIGFPRHLSQHPAASSSPSGRMAELVPVENASDAGPQRHPVGQGRPRRARPAQGRHPRHRHAERDPPLARATSAPSSADAGARDGTTSPTTTRPPTT